MTQSFPGTVQAIADWLPLGPAAGFFLATYVLVFSRCLPGTRLPAYLAAGFLRLPPGRFLAITGVAGFIWTFGILFLADRLGTRLVHWINLWKHGGLILLGGAALLFCAFQSWHRWAPRIEWRVVAAKVARWRRWEFWPAWLFYPPVAVHYGWLAVKYRGVTVPTAANPGIFAGGIVGESKIEILEALARSSPAFTAVAERVLGDDLAARLQSLDEIRARLDLPYPFILKPDVGQRGAGVKLIRTRAQAEEYLCQTAAPLIAQRYVPGPYETGIFYYRFPGQARGKIFAITEKVFPELTGDGCRTLAELVHGDARARLIAGVYLRRFAARRQEIPAAGERVRLVEAGNHAQGCIFRDGRHLWSAALEKRLDEISKKMDGFYIGRYDIRYRSENDLRAGRNFQIVELNGAASEATSIYDTRNSLAAAYRTLFRQWELVFAIGAENRRRGIAPASLAVVWKAWREYSRTAATYPAAD